MVVVRSAISSELKGRTLKRGALFTCSGGSLFLISAFLPISFLSSYGLTLFLASCVLVAKGLVPYRRLLLEEIHPNEIHFDETALSFFQKKRPLFTIEQEDIEKIEYVEKRGTYGIALSIKHPLRQQVKVHASKQRFTRYQIRYKSMLKSCDLFLPYFSKRSYHELITSWGQDCYKPD